MKTIFFALCMITITMSGLAQSHQSIFKQLTDLYADKDGFSASQISNDMFDLYLKKRNIEKESPVSEALEKLDNIIVVSQSKISRGAALVRGGYITPETANEKENKEDNELHQLVLDHYKSNNYTMLKTEKRMGEDVKVYLKKNGESVESLALVTNSSVSTNLVELQCDIDLQAVAQLGETLNLRGLENLYKIDNSSSGISRAYGIRNSGEFFTQERINEMIARQKELAEKNNQLTEEQRAKIEERAREMELKQKEMAEKYRQLAETYGRQPIFLSAPGDTNTVYYLNGKKVKAKEIKELDKSTIKTIEVKGDEKNGKTKITIRTK